VRGFLFALDLVFDVDELALDEGVVFGELAEFAERCEGFFVAAFEDEPAGGGFGRFGTVHERANSRLGRC
jgi:hypothetical protein